MRVAAKNPLVNNRNLAPNRCKRKATHVPLGRGVSVGIQFLLLMKDSGCLHTYSKPFMPFGNKEYLGPALSDSQITIFFSFLGVLF